MLCPRIEPIPLFPAFDEHAFTTTQMPFRLKVLLVRGEAKRRALQYIIPSRRRGPARQSQGARERVSVAPAYGYHGTAKTAVQSARAQAIDIQ